MKFRFGCLALLLLPVLLTSCGKRAASEPATPRPADLPALADSSSVTLKLPGPRDLPACPGLVSVGEIRGNDQTGAAVLVSSHSIPAILEFYTTTLAEDGWILGSSLPQGKEHHLQFSQGRRFLRFQIGPSEESGTTRILLAWKQPAGTQESGDAYAPESEEPEPDDIRERSVEW